jgi:hypothetical protein
LVDPGVFLLVEIKLLAVNLILLAQLVNNTLVILNDFRLPIFNLLVLFHADISAIEPERLPSKLDRLVVIKDPVSVLHEVSLNHSEPLILGHMVQRDERLFDNSGRL